MKRNRVYIALATLPVIFCSVITALWGYDGPYWDSWWKVPLIVEAFEGEFGVADCWVLVNEHRIFFPNLLTVPIARWTHWTVGVELALTIVFAAAAFMIIARVILKDVDAAHHWLIPFVSLLMFSYSQHNVWMWGMHVAITMALLGMVAAVFVLTREVLGWKHIVLAAAFGVFACYSFGAGVAVWGVGLVIVGFRVCRSETRRWSLLAGWVATAVIAMAVYFIGYESTPATTSATDAILHPVQFAQYVFAYLGGPLASWSGTVACVLGMLGVAGVIGLILRSLQNIEPTRRSDGFALGLVLVGVGCALLTALKSWPEGVNQAVSSRYLAWPTMFWVGFVLLLTPATSKRTRLAIVGVITLCAAAASLHGTYKANERHDAYALGRAAYVANEREEDWLYLYPTLDVPRDLRDDLVTYRLAFFRLFRNDEDAHEKAVE